jgi:CheY-like chemotaxis protein
MFSAVRELLINVAKHAGVRTASVAMELRPSGELCIVVSDSGCGFDPAEVEARAGYAGGFGLFAIGERMESLGGRFLIESSPGKGSRFTLSAPVEPDMPDPAPETGRTADNLPDGTPPVRDEPDTAADGSIRVLLVDDHQVVRQGLAHLLSQAPDIRVAGEAPDGETALAMARQLCPDVVLMDVNMPGMNGVETTRRLHGELPDTIVIGLSMYNQAHRADEMRNAGASAYLSKDEAAETVVAAIRSCCRDRSLGSS